MRRRKPNTVKKRDPMQILLSCAKTMSDEGSFAAPRTTEPRFLRQAGELAARMAALTTDELARLLRVNGTLAAENRQRYLRFHDADREAVAALAAYTGIVFRHIAPERFTADDLEYAQCHLHITSFLYGLLRPLDAIRPYRLEADVRLPGLDAPLFYHWPTRLNAPPI